MRKWSEKAFCRVETDVATGMARGAILNRLRVFYRLSPTTWSAVRSAFRRHGKTLPAVKKKLVVVGSGGVAVPAELKKKCLRRARRHFHGRHSVTHRVVSKSSDSLVFRFNRGSVKIPGLPQNYEVTVTRQ